MIYALDFNDVLGWFILFFHKALDISEMSSLLLQTEWHIFSLLCKRHRSLSIWAQSQLILREQLAAMSSVSEKAEKSSPRPKGLLLSPVLWEAWGH